MMDSAIEKWKEFTKLFMLPAKEYPETFIYYLFSIIYLFSRSLTWVFFPLLTKGEKGMKEAN